MSGSSRICSSLIAGSNPFSNTAIFSLSHAKVCEDFSMGLVRAASVSSLVNKLLKPRAY